MPGSHRTANAVCLYLLMMFVVVNLRPATVFRADGRVRRFGAGPSPDASVFSGVVVASACAIASVLLSMGPQVARVLLANARRAHARSFEAVEPPSAVGIPPPTTAPPPPPLPARVT